MTANELKLSSSRGILALLCCFTPALSVQQAQNLAPNPNITLLDADGTARISRIVPVPKTISPEAQALLATGKQWCPSPSNPESVPEFKALIERAKKLYPVDIEENKVLGGVKTKWVTPADGVPASRKNRVIINLHGGGFTEDSGSYVESIPIANLTKTLVVSVDYRMAPEHKFPDAVDDVIAVYKELLKTYKPANIGMYGTSAGAALTLMATVRIRHDGLPQPGALGVFSGNGDSSQPTDSSAMFSVAGLIGARIPSPGNQRSAFLGDHDPKDPLVSPIYADLKSFPPTLCMSGTRDTALVGTANFNRALRRNGDVTELVVFDGLPHAFWYTTGIPESTEALEIQAKWFNDKLGR
jgi:monoterpene epsilon-lactone hydrolase